jgi:thiol reductant ABC exporter CydC subunit
MQTWINLLRFVAPYKGRAAWATVLAFFTVAANVGLMGTSGFLIAKAALRPETVLLLWVPIVGVRFFGLSRGVFRYLERLASHDVTFRILAQLRIWMFGKIEPQAHALFRRRQSADVIGSIMSDVEQLQYFYLRVLAPSLVAILTTVLGFFVLLPFGLGLSIILVLGMSVAGIAIPWLSQHLARPHGEHEVELKSNFYTQTGDLLSGMQELAMNGQLDHSVNQLTATQHRLDQSRTANNAITAWTGGGMLSLVNGTMWIVLVYSIQLVNAGQLAGWAIPVTVLVTLACFEAILPLPLAFQHMEQTKRAAERFFAIAEQAEGPQRPEPKTPTNARPMDGTIELRDVHVRYDAERGDALSALNLHVAAGEHVAIVGASGAGKSTLLHVLTATIPYAQGSVTLGGVELQTMDAHTVREQVAVVPQQPYFFHASIEENLRIAKPSATQAELHAALDRAQLGPLIASLPDGLRTLVGEWGTRFSGGERQRLALARAILRDAPIVLLDEPTTGLDATTAAAFWQATEHALTGKTVLWITHDESEARRMDRVVRLHKGTI